MTSDRLKNTKLMILDIDGVLTDGSIIYDDGGREIKIFNVKDGLGIRLLMEAGIDICVATGRSSEALRHRCRDLGIVHIFDGIKDKVAVLDLLLDRLGLTAKEVAFIGDDLPDLALMKRVGFSVAVADAHEIIVENADMVTLSKGGKGAVREVAEIILKAQGRWDTLLKRFL